MQNILDYDIKSYPVPRQFIAGEWRRGGDGTAGRIQNPADQSVLGEIPAASGTDLDDALAAADAAGEPWLKTSTVARGEILSARPVFSGSESKSWPDGIGINSGSVSQIGAPFGGIKDSGIGYEGGPEGLMAYMHQKYIHHA